MIDERLYQGEEIISDSGYHGHSYKSFYYYLHSTVHVQQFLEPKNTVIICIQRTQRWSVNVKICPTSLENSDQNTSQNCEDTGMIKKNLTNEPIWSKRSSNSRRAIGRKQSKSGLTSNKEKDFRVYGETPTL